MSALFTAHRVANAGCVIPGTVNCVTELTFSFKHGKGDPHLAADVEVEFHTPDGRCMRVPAFNRRGRTWSVRYAPECPGQHRFRLPGAPPIEGVIEAVPYAGSNPLLTHGPVRMDCTGRHFAHADGTPFFWLADCWWHGMSARLTMSGFRKLTADRAAKGFSAIKFSLGFSCDMDPYDPRDANSHGHPWLPDYASINPAFYDEADKRVLHVIEKGMAAGIVGMWGYYLPFMGVEKAKRHWRQLVARYGAFPGVWILCGEAALIAYPETRRKHAVLAAREPADIRREQRDGWSAVGQMVRAVDQFQRPLMVHPGPGAWDNDSTPLADVSVCDVILVQPGHGDFDAPIQLQRQIVARRATFPDKPVMNGECAFEGMHGGATAKTQRRIFWTAVLAGAPGHAYGADALWQMNSRKQPFGPSPGGYVWGNEPWEDALHWLGSKHVGVGRAILAQFEWWRIEPRPGWAEPSPEQNQHVGIVAAEIPGQTRLYYFATVTPWGAKRILGLTPGASYKAEWISPLDGTRHAAGLVTADAEGAWRPACAPVIHDWLLVLRPREQ